MRSELVYSAGIQISNRFLLSVIAIGAVRKLHVSSTRVEDTTNHVFTEVARGNYVQAKMPELKAPDLIDSLVLSAAG